MARERCKIHCHPRFEKNVQRIFRFQTCVARRDGNEVVVLPNDSFRQQKAGGQFPVMAWRAHRHRHTPTAHANFQRLFHGEEISS